MRDWVCVNDVAGVLSSMGHCATEDAPKFNVGTGIGTAVREIAQRVIDAWHGDARGVAELSFTGASRPGDPFSLVASAQKSMAFGFACDFPIVDGIAQYVQWFKRLQVSTDG